MRNVYLWPTLLLPAILVWAVYGPAALQCGLFLDDYAYFPQFGRGSLSDVWREFLHFYIAGRNLVVFYFAAVLRLTRESAPALQLLGLAVDATTAALAAAFVHELTRLRSAALVAALILALAPSYGENHFWLTLLPQVRIPLLFAVAAFWIASRSRPRLPLRLGCALALYTAAFFAYDQFFFLWPLLLTAAWLRTENSRSPSPALVVEDRARGGPPRPRPRSFLAAALYGVFLNSAHVFLRQLSPDVFPFAKFSNFPEGLRRCVAATIQGILSLHCVGPALSSSQTVGVATAAALGVALIYFYARRLASSERTELQQFYTGAAWKKLALFGLAWFFLAYLPNFFGYVAPRNNQLPALGWAMVCVAAVGRLLHRFPRSRWPALAICGILAARAVVADVHEGAEWVHSSRLHRAYIAETDKFAGAIDNIFLLGAPRAVGRAQAFNLPHSSVRSVAYHRSLVSLEGDYQFTPTRRGVFYGNDLSVAPRREFRWLPFERINAVGYFPEDGFRCLKDIHVMLPNGSRLGRSLRPAPLCSRHVDLATHAALASARILPKRRPRITAQTPIPGVALADFSMEVRRDLLVLRLEWAVEKAPGFPFAVVPVVVSETGERLFEPIYPLALPGRTSPILWPLVNDDIPAPRWRPGENILEMYHLRMARPIPPGRHRALLEIYRLHPGASSAYLGVIEVPYQLF